MSGRPPHQPLHGNQQLAVAPDRTVWLSASAGTGKTQVLSSRVLRLLLQPGTEPSQILCLTFTKAGATEMASRINDRLAHWVRLDDARLAAELKAIGADLSPATRERARTLFAAVLDCPGGGLRIDTIHAFSQWLLAAFPLEAGLPPGSRAMEDRERVLLQRQVLADLLVAAESDPLGDPQLLDALADLSLRMGPEAVEDWLMRCAEARDAWFGPGGWQEPMRHNVERLLGLPAGASDADVAALCADQQFDTMSLRRCLQTLGDWGTATGREGADAIRAWLDCDEAGRAASIEELYTGLFTKTTGAPRQLNNILKRDPDYERFIGSVGECMAAIREFRVLLALADRLVPAFRLGRAFALAWDEAKQREGLIDFDDQIRNAAALLTDSTQAQWIAYKLDRRFDHILVDEAQDTNAAQWRIIDALTQEFFAGFGQRGDLMRTLFVVGDYKQAIFRFQGTSPENFRAASERVRAYMQGAVDNAAGLRGTMWPQELLELGLDRSFRTGQPVLDFVDRAIAQVGFASFGLDQPPDRHEGEERPGYVALWRPVGESGPDDDPEDSDEGLEGWLSKPDRQLAERIARQVREWIDKGFPLLKGGKRAAGPGDVMVLVRKRRELAGLIVARLHAAGVPVAGVDRLRLGAPLAVRDLVAALRFAAQPFDDLNLASLLVSPLIGWSQDDLLRLGYRSPEDAKAKVSLWRHLRRSSESQAAATVGQLNQLLAKADYDPPQALLHWLLVGPWQGRRGLVARLGREANDPIDELLNAAHAYAMTGTPSLVGFLAWFDAGEGELKREADGAGGLTRVMTVHGAKGLQAPIVILADATGDPERGRAEDLDLADPAAPDDRFLPMPTLPREDQVGRIAEARDVAARESEQEHWRLLYVAMTRAEEALFVAGALGPRDRGEVSAGSWYAALRALFGADDWVSDPIWNARLEWGDVPEVVVRSEQASPELPLAPPLPDWLATSVRDEPRPPRPLAPSSLGEDLGAEPPPYPGSGAEAARRGVLIHKLLERLPEIVTADRAAAGDRWLIKNAPHLDGEGRDGLVRQALGAIEHPDWSDLFSPQALAEVPIAAVVGERVLAGTIDRLLVGQDIIRLVDFKTSRRPPSSLDEVPAAIIRQMAAYAAALETTYPGRTVEAALLYTYAPRLIEIPASELIRHKAALLSSQ